MLEGIKKCLDKSVFDKEKIKKNIEIYNKSLENKQLDSLSCIVFNRDLKIYQEILKFIESDS